MDEEDSDAPQEEDVGSCLDIEEDHMGEIEEQLIATQQLPPLGPGVTIEEDILISPENQEEATFYPLQCQMDEEAPYLNPGLCYDQSSISDSIGQFASGAQLYEARMGSAFFTPKNNLCHMQSELGVKTGQSSETTVGTLNRKNLRFLQHILFQQDSFGALQANSATKSVNGDLETYSVEDLESVDELIAGDAFEMVKPITDFEHFQQTEAKNLDFDPMEENTFSLQLAAYQKTYPDVMNESSVDNYLAKDPQDSVGSSDMTNQKSMPPWLAWCWQQKQLMSKGGPNSLHSFTSFTSSSAKQVPQTVTRSLTGSTGTGSTSVRGAFVNHAIVEANDKYNAQSSNFSQKAQTVAKNIQKSQLKDIKEALPNLKRKRASKAQMSDQKSHQSIKRQKTTNKCDREDSMKQPKLSRIPTYDKSPWPPERSMQSQNLVAPLPQVRNLSQTLRSSQEWAKASQTLSDQQSGKRSVSSSSNQGKKLQQGNKNERKQIRSKDERSKDQSQVDRGRKGGRKNISPSSAKEHSPTTPKFVTNVDSGQDKDHFPDQPFSEAIKPTHVSIQKATLQVELKGSKEPPPRPAEPKDAQPCSSVFDKARYQKVINFWTKKERRCFEKKIVSKKRKKVADNKLRIQGKFVTIEQAIKLVGKRQVNKLLKEARGSDKVTKRKKSTKKVSQRMQNQESCNK